MTYNIYKLYIIASFFQYSIVTSCLSPVTCNFRTSVFKLLAAPKPPRDPRLRRGAAVRTVGAGRPVGGFGAGRFKQIAKTWIFSWISGMQMRQETPPKFFHNSPHENWWLEDKPFLLGFGNFSGANC